MGLDDGAADRESYSDPARLCSEERFKNTFKIFRSDPLPRVGNRDKYITSFVVLGGNLQLPRPIVDRTHRFHRIQYQVERYLLQLDAITLNGRQTVCKASPD